MMPPVNPSSAGWRFDNSYVRLPEVCFSRVKPTPVGQPNTVLFNRDLARSLGLDAEALADESASGVFSGNVLPAGSEPIAQAYAGHQFGNFTRLGDGRAILLGEQITPAGTRFDIQLKGAGPTLYSRSGDGRAALGPMLREYVVSEAMHALGIPTTRSLAVASTGEPVFRDRPLPGAVLTRVAASHIRVGTFEYLSALGDHGALRALVNFTVARHFPEIVDSPNLPLALLAGVLERQASLVVAWLRVGFVHGVMNTDNMALSGETIDYGPCAFLDAYDPATVFSSIDRGGRYAFARQPPIVAWNLSRLAEALLPVLDPDPTRSAEQAEGILATYPEVFGRHWLTMMRGKLGLFTEEIEDTALADDLLQWMQRHQADYTHTFRKLAPNYPVPTGKSAEPGFTEWHQRWTDRLARQPQPLAEATARRHAHTPAVIPRNRQVEEALELAVEGRDLSAVNRLLAALANPYDEAGKPPELLTPPESCHDGYCTFCGT